MNDRAKVGNRGSVYLGGEMRIADSGKTHQKAAMLIRFLVIVNFALLLVLVGPGRSHELDLALRRAGVEDLIGRLFQIWIVSSTILATAVFAFLVWRRRRRTPPSEAAFPRIRVEGVLLLAWWGTILAFLAYGFMLGMGG
jgi:hypothetical protein